MLGQDSLQALFGGSLTRDDLAELTERGGWTSFRARWARYGMPGQDDTIAVKLGSDWQAGDAESVFQAMRQLADLMASSPGPVAALDPIGWSSDPEAIAMKFVAGSTFVEMIRDLDEPDADVAPIARAFGMALGSYHTEGVREEVGEDVRAELEAAARRVLVDRDKAWQIAQGLVAASCYELSTNDLWVGQAGELILLDPPVRPSSRLVHRDLSAVVVGLEAVRARSPEPARTQASHALTQFLHGYGETGPTDLGSDSDRWALRLYEASRVAGVSYGHFRGRRVSRGVRASWRTLRLRASMGVSGSTTP